MPATLGDLLPVLAALAGAFVGGVIAELRTLLQGSRERRRALRFLLYQLLDLRFSIQRMDPHRLIATLRRIMERRFGPEAVQEFDAPLVQSFFRQALDAVGASMEPPRSESRYAAAVDALAPYDPILAYRLGEQNQLAHFDREVRSYFDRVRYLPEVVSDPNSPHAIELIQSASLEVVRSEVLKTLREHIQMVSSGISQFCWWRASRVLRRQDKASDPELDKSVEKLIDTFIERLKPHGAA